MGLEKIQEEVLDRAKKEAQRILREATDEKSLLMGQTEQKLKAIRDRTQKETKKTMESAGLRESVSAEMEIKRLELEAKKDAIDDVFEKVKGTLKALDPKKREQHLKKLANKAKKEIEVAFLYSNKQDLSFVKDLGCETKEEGIIGGLIAENKDRSIRIDYSFDTLIESLKEAHLQDIAKILFHQK